MVTTIVEKINYLPEHLHKDVEHYIDFLIRKHFYEKYNAPGLIVESLDQRKEQHLLEKDKALTLSQLKEEMSKKYGI